MGKDEKGIGEVNVKWYYYSMASKNPRKEAEETLLELEDIWKKFDRVYDSLSEDKWQAKFGRDWIFADQPYHLSFFDRMVANSLSQSAKISKKDRFLLKDLGQINSWNEREFKKRPKSYTPQDSRREFEKSHEAIRKAFAKQQSWDEKVWMPLFFGWVDALEAIAASLVHNVGEYMELCMRSGKPVNVLPQSIRRRSGFMMLFMSLGVKREEALKRDFVMGWNFTGEGGSKWTIEIAKGAGQLKEGAVKDPDLSMTMNPVAFERMLRKMRNPLLMMLTGEMKVKGFTKLPAFMKLFPQP